MLDFCSNFEEVGSGRIGKKEKTKSPVKISLLSGAYFYRVRLVK